MSSKYCSFRTLLSTQLNTNFISPDFESHLTYNQPTTALFSCKPQDAYAVIYGVKISQFSDYLNADHFNLVN